MIQRALLAILLLFPRISSASEIMEAGQVLKEDSVVFTIEEAEKLKARIFELEKKEDLLEEYKVLCEVKDSKIDLYKVNEALYKDQIDRYSTIINLQDKRLDKYNKIQTASEYRDIGIFVLGVSVTVASILMADKVNDTVVQY